MLIIVIKNSYIGRLMNKFQKVALLMAKDDKRSGVDFLKDEPLKKAAGHWYFILRGIKVVSPIRKLYILRNVIKHNVVI